MNRRQITKLAARALKEYRVKERAWYRQVTTSVADEHSVQCKSGCNHCCYQLALGSLVSGILIADHLGRMNPERLAAVEAQGDEQCKVFLQHGPDAGAEVWFADHYQPCALLVEATGFCSVYELRPPMCSSYYVVSDPGLCVKAKAGTIVGSLDNRPIEFEALRLDAELLAAVSGEPERANDVMLSPLGTMVKMGRRLLEGDLASVLSAGIAMP